MGWGGDIGVGYDNVFIIIVIIILVLRLVEILVYLVECKLGY